MFFERDGRLVVGVIGCFFEVAHEEDIQFFFKSFNCLRTGHLMSATIGYYEEEECE
jgi:hypothetical protein